MRTGSIGGGCRAFCEWATRGYDYIPRYWASTMAQ